MAKMTFKKVPFAIGAIGFVLCLSTQAQTLKTPAEEANYLQYSQHEEVARFLSSLAFLSKEVTVQVIGKTKEVKNFPSKDLYLCMVTEEGASTPQALNRNKLTLMLTAAQHGNEHSAKEAALRLIRDIALSDLKPLLKKAILVDQVWSKVHHRRRFNNRRMLQLPPGKLHFIEYLRDQIRGKIVPPARHHYLGEGIFLPTEDQIRSLYQKGLVFKMAIEDQNLLPSIR